MPADAVMRSTRPVTHSGLVTGLRALGVQTGCVLMVQTRMSAIGWVVGAAETDRAQFPSLPAAVPGTRRAAWLGAGNHPALPP